MGSFFVMSNRFNKSAASDFGLDPIDKTTAIDPKNGSVWIMTELYDFGWGKEIGFYKEPLPDFDALFDIAIHSNDRDDMYGSAAIILDKYPYELLCKCELMIDPLNNKKDFMRMVLLFDLEKPLNRCETVHKTIKEIRDDFARWKRVSDVAKRINGSNEYCY